VLIYVITLSSVLRPVGPQTQFDLDSFGALPVTFEGRTQPIDTLARNSLKIIAAREAAYTKDGRISPTAWIADVFARPEKAADYPVFRIDEPQLVGMLNLDPKQHRYSFRDLFNQKDKLQEELDKAEKVDPKQRDLFQSKVIELVQKLQRYSMLGQMDSLFLIPPYSAKEQWQPFGKAMKSNDGQPHPAADTWINLIASYHDDKPATFNSTVASYTQTLEQKVPRAEKKAQFEQLFNKFDPFTQCIVLYLLAFLMVMFSWLFWTVPLRRAAVLAVLIALVIHTAGLIGRIYISGRPPVTNLASSAIFIAWGGVILAIGLELFFRNGLGTICAAIMGFLSLLISDRLSLSGDTMAVLQAVLDTNFWLATHVVVITLGYAATFLAGVLGITYVIRGVFTKTLTKSASKELSRMIYAIVCFAILFSFVGTILGGIWADQSWGRFWGWDPKENGAVLIVLANAILLHARWGGMVQARGIACLAIFGNIVTSWSWFGVNMLGVGLHSYGFMQSALFWLLLFVLSQVVLIGIGALPLAWWRSYEALTSTAVPIKTPPRAQAPQGALPAGI
jgi:ABC-type transport system involved in cytochrome c biogenesis permease subunit